APGIASVAAFVAATAAFFHVERGKPGALVPLDLFRNTEFNAALAAAGTMTFGMYAMMFLTPLYLQNMGHTSAFMAAVYMLPASVAFIIVSQLNGRIVRKLGARVVMTAGLACMGSGLLILAGVSQAPNLWLI